MSVLLALSFLLRVTQVTEAFIYFWTFPVFQLEISLIPVSPSTTWPRHFTTWMPNLGFFFHFFLMFVSARTGKPRLFQGPSYSMEHVLQRKKGRNIRVDIT